MKKSYIYYNQIDKEPGINQQQNFDIRKKKIVDINKLLNRVKVNNRNELKKKILLFTLTILTICCMATILIIVK